MPEVDESHSPQRHHPYEGAGFSIMGDSISTLAGWVPEGWRVHYQGEVRIDGVELPEDTWWGRVIGALRRGALWPTRPFPGRRWRRRKGSGFRRATATSASVRLQVPVGDLPDAVIVFMGINDYGWGGARNQTMGRSAAASARPEDLDGPREVAATADVDALARFQRAYASMLARIRRLAPAVDIWCVTACEPGTRRPRRRASAPRNRSTPPNPLTPRRKGFPNHPDRKMLPFRLRRRPAGSTAFAASTWTTTTMSSARKLRPRARALPIFERSASTTTPLMVCIPAPAAWSSLP